MLIVIFEFGFNVLIFADKVHKVRNVHKVPSAIFYTFPLVFNCIAGGVLSQRVTISKMGEQGSTSKMWIRCDILRVWHISGR